MLLGEGIAPTEEVPVLLPTGVAVDGTRSVQLTWEGQSEAAEPHQLWDMLPSLQQTITFTLRNEISLVLVLATRSDAEEAKREVKAQGLCSHVRLLRSPAVTINYGNLAEVLERLVGTALADRQSPQYVHWSNSVVWCVRMLCVQHSSSLTYLDRVRTVLVVWCDAAYTFKEVSYCKVALLGTAFAGHRSQLLPWIDVLGHEGAFAAVAACRTTDLAQFVGREMTLGGVAIYISAMLDLSDEMCHWAQLQIAFSSPHRCSSCDSCPAKWSKQAHGSGDPCRAAERNVHFEGVKSDLACLLAAIAEDQQLEKALKRCRMCSKLEAFHQVLQLARGTGAHKTIYY